MKKYQKTCTVLQFSGDEEWNGGIEKNRLYFGFNFAQPATVTTHGEYLIYDAIGVIGSVGGTLGMFIGFSFSNAVSYITNKISMCKAQYCK